MSRKSIKNLRESLEKSDLYPGSCPLDPEEWQYEVYPVSEASPLSSPLLCWKATKPSMLALHAHW